MRTISRIEVFPVAVPITRTFKFASGSAGTAGETAKLIYVKITDSDGAVGWGEGRPHPQWSYETPAGVVQVIRDHLAPALIGNEMWDRRGLHQRMHQQVGRGPSTGMPVAKAAIDLALHDLCAKAAGLPLRCFLGGAQADSSVELSWTVAVTTAEDAAKEIEAGQAAGFRQFNFKITPNQQEDEKIARRIIAATAPGGLIWADANQGLPVVKAAGICNFFHDLGVEVIEQPLPADELHQMRHLRQKTAMRLAVDEASVSPADFFQYVRENLVDYLVLKLTRTGGIWPTLEQIGTASAAGLPFLVSGLADGMMVKTAVCQVAASRGYRGPAALNGSQFMDDSRLFPRKAEVEKDGAIHLGEAPGIGIDPDESALRKYAWDLT